MVGIIRLTYRKVVSGIARRTQVQWADNEVFSSPYYRLISVHFRMSSNSNNSLSATAKMKSAMIFYKPAIDEQRGRVVLRLTDSIKPMIITLIVTSWSRLSRLTWGVGHNATSICHNEVGGACHVKVFPAAVDTSYWSQFLLAARLSITAWQDNLCVCHACRRTCLPL